MNAEKNLDLRISLYSMQLTYRYWHYEHFLYLAIIHLFCLPFLFFLRWVFLLELLLLLQSRSEGDLKMQESLLWYVFFLSVGFDILQQKRRALICGKNIIRVKSAEIYQSSEAARKNKGQKCGDLSK